MHRLLPVTLVVSVLAGALLSADVKFTSAWRSSEAGTVSFAGKKVAALVISGRRLAAHTRRGGARARVDRARHAIGRHLSDCTEGGAAERRSRQGLVREGEHRRGRRAAPGTRTAGTTTPACGSVPPTAPSGAITATAGGPPTFSAAAALDTTVVVETTIYSVPQNRLLWAAVSETRQPGGAAPRHRGHRQRVGEGTAQAGPGPPHRPVDPDSMAFRPLVALLACLFAVTAPAAAQDQPPPRPTVGVAFGGGSARGIAHVGVIKWFEEHRIPIDMAAGTSMGGLIGGAFATGMDAAALDQMLKQIDWDEMFGASSFAFKNIRRKADARAYPSRLEFGVKRRIVAPTSLNNGQEVDWLVGRIAAPYYAAATFDELPTPFRAVAVDLLSAAPVVLDRGPLASAMRATMSLPLIFPPVQLDGHLLVDGGVMDNVPADVVRRMGATRVVAVNVGDLSDRPKIDSSMFALAGATLDAMMRANTKVAIKDADVIINVPLASYGSLDWRRSPALIDEGYKAAEAMRDVLLPLAVSEAEFARWTAGRQARRRTALPAPAFARVEGFSGGDERVLTRSSQPPRRRVQHRLLRDGFGAALRPGPLRNDHVAPRHEPRRRERASSSGATQSVRSAVSDAGPEPGEHHLRGLSRHAHRPLSRLRHHRVRLRAARRRDTRLGPRPGHGAPQAAWRHVAVRRALRRHFQPRVQRHSGRRGGGELRTGFEPGRPGRRDEPGTGERSPPGRLCRPTHRQRRCRGSGAACRQGQANGDPAQMAVRLAG